MLNAWILKGPLTPACYIIAGQVDCSQQGKTALRPPGNASVGGLLPGSFTFTEFCKKKNTLFLFVLFCFLHLFVPCTCIFVHKMFTFILFWCTKLFLW